MEEEDALYRTLFEHAPVGILVADAHSYYLDANPGMCQMLGYTHDELIGLHASDIVVQIEVAHIDPALEDIKSYTEYHREWEFKRKDGSTFLAEVNATMMPDGRLLGMVRDISARRESELLATRLAGIVEDCDDAILSLDLNGIIVSWNSGAEKIFGYRAIAMIGTSILRLIPHHLQNEELLIMGKNLRGEKVAQFETLRLTRDQRLIEVTITASPIKNASGKMVGISKVVRDITVLKMHERELVRMTRLYDALSQINQAIVWSKTREELFDTVCRVLLENGRFRMIWIGWRDPATEQIVPLAVAGDTSGYIKNIKIYADDRPEGHGPSGTAFRAGEPYICNCLQEDPKTLPWRAEIDRRGFRASAVFPIMQQEEVRGILNVYSDEEDFFHAEEITLLQEAMGDISFALDNLAREEMRVQAEILAQSEKNFSETMLESMPGILYFYNEEGNFLRWNRNFELVSGYSCSEIEHMHPLDFFSAAEKEMLRHRISEVFAKGESFVEASFVAKDGSSKPYFFTGRRIEFNGLPCLVGMGIDISERKEAELQLRAMQGRLEAVVENLREGLVMADPESDMLRWNPESLRLLGFAELEEGRRRQHDFDKIFEVFTLDGVRLAYEHWPLARVRRGETINDFQVVVRRLDIEWEKIISYTGCSVEYASGKKLAFLTLQDITQRKQAEEALKSNEREQRQLAQLLEGERTRLAAAQRVAKVGSWETDLHTMAVAWSNETYRIFELDPEKFDHTHQDFLRYVHPEDRNALEEAFLESIRLRSDNLIELEHRLLLPDGHIKYVEERWNVQSDEQAKPIRVVGTCQDITDRKMIENGVKRLNRVLAFVSEMNALIVRVSSRDELFWEACRIASSAGGFRMSLITILDHRTTHLMPIASTGKNDDLLAEITRILAAPEGEHTMIVRAMKEKRVVLSNEAQNDVALTLPDIYARYGVNSIANFPLVVADEVVGVLSLYSTEPDFFHEDEIALLTELTGDIVFAIGHIDRQERLNYLAYYDELTGLANRTLFFERVGQFIRSAEKSASKLAFFLIDLERFKNFNDSLGRVNGDDLLKKVAVWLTAQTGNVNLLARIGADQFAMALPGIVTESDVARQVDKMLGIFLKHSLLVNETEFRVSAKIGIALFPNDGTEVETLFRNAESALKMAKKTGDRYLFHNKKMTEAVTSKLSLENQLRQAIDNEEFVLHYQPKFHVLDGTLSGAEALIRWNRPGIGLIAPGDFIPILEETGLIYDVGRWALRQAIEDTLHWRATRGVSVRIAVNVSPLQLRDPEFVADIRQKVDAARGAADGLEIEITESMLMEDIEGSIITLQAIRDMGIMIAIDDFGTGFSSLAYLSRLPLNTLKIDRSFIVGMNRGPEGIALVSTIVNLAHSMKLKVVAEGVETELQSSQLAQMQCDEIQGFLCGRSMPAKEFETRFMP